MTSSNKNNIIIHPDLIYHMMTILLLFLQPIFFIILLGAALTTVSARDNAPFEEDFSEGIGSECLVQVHNAITENDPVQLKQLLQKYAKKSCINEIIPDNSGQTLIMHAVLTGKTTEIVSLLLDHGADVTIGEYMGYTPIHGAGFQGRAELAKLLVQKANMNVMDRHKDDGFTPLHRACWGSQPRHTETVKVLLELGADPDDEMCMKRPVSSSTNGEQQQYYEECRHLIEATQNPETVKVLKAFTKLDKYKLKQDEL